MRSVVERARLLTGWTRVAWERARHGWAGGGLGYEAPHVPLDARLGALVRRYVPSESQHLYGLTLALGALCGLIAVGFHLALQGAEHLLIDRALAAPGRWWVVLGVLSPALGGLVAGLALRALVPRAAGSGIPQVKEAFAFEGGRVRFRDAVGKFVLSVVQIGSGASLGREGPTVHICAGASSLLARATALPPRSARRLLPVAAAAAIAAAFNAPIAAVTFTIEEIVGKLDQTVLSGVVIAAAVAAVIERAVLGVHPVIEVSQPYALDHASSLALYGLLGIIGAVVSVAFSEGLLGLRAWFRALRRVPAWAHPALGGAVTGAAAVVVYATLRVTGVAGGGYETLGLALAGGLGINALVALGAAKFVGTLFSYSSGGVGGIFAPTLFLGGMLGGAVGNLDVALLHHEPSQIGAFALVGMGAVFAGVVRAPITSVLIIFEMTGGYGLVLPLMVANMTAFVLARHWRPMPVYDALLAQDGVHLPKDAAPRHPYEELTVADAMTARVVRVGPDETVAAALVECGDREVTLVPVTTPAGALLGAVRRARLAEAARSGDGDAPVRALLEPAHMTFPDVPLSDAVVAMEDAATRQLVVVARGREAEVAGVLTISDVVRAHARAAAGARRADVAAPPAPLAVTAGAPR